MSKFNDVSLIKVGVIGFDTSHVPAFTRLLNDSSDPHHVSGARIVAGFPSFSPDLESSASRVDEYTRQVRDEFGVRILDSIDEVIEQCDAILLESVDGRRHLEEARPVLEARRPLFIDKPLAADYSAAAALVRLAREHDCPLFSSSSLRFDANISALRSNGQLGRVLGCDAFSPATLEPTNPGLFWYGVHGVEILYTFMGAGCHAVRSLGTENCDVVIGTWSDGRIGTMRGTRCGAHGYGVTVYGHERVAQSQFSQEIPLYSQLLRQIIPFFAGGAAPVPMEETLEIMAFMQAALLSERENREVELREVTQAPPIAP